MNRQLPNPPAPPRETILVPLGRDGFALRISTDPRRPDGELIQLTASEPIVFTRLSPGELETFTALLQYHVGQTR